MRGDDHLDAGGARTFAGARALRDWAERARLIVYDYRRFYGTDHRNQELARRLDAAAKQLMEDWEDW